MRGALWCAVVRVRVGGHVEEESQEARPRVRRSRSGGQAPQAPGWSRQRRWSAPPPHQLRQVPPGVLRQAGHALLPQDQEPVPLPHHQPGQGVDPRQRRHQGEVRGREGHGQGAGHRRRQIRQPHHRTALHHTTHHHTSTHYTACTISITAAERRQATCTSGRRGGGSGRWWKRRRVGSAGWCMRGCRGRCGGCDDESDCFNPARFDSSQGLDEEQHSFSNH